MTSFLRRGVRALEYGVVVCLTACTTGPEPAAPAMGSSAPKPTYMQQLRIEGWKQLLPFTQASSGLPASPKWTPSMTLLPDNSHRSNVSFVLKPDLRVEKEGPALWEASFFNQAATTYVTTIRLNEWDTTDVLRKEKAVRGLDFPYGSQVIKTFWYRVPRQQGSEPVPVLLWDWRKIGDGVTQAPLDRLREVCVESQPKQGCLRADEAFYTATVKQQDLQNFTCGTCKEVLNDGDLLILVGMHVATKIRPEWLWATFWWRDKEEERGKPWPTGSSWTCVDAQRKEAIGDVTLPWSNYSMDVTASFKRPKPAVNTQEGCGEPGNIGSAEQKVAMYNPFSEARFGNGLKTSCVQCHSLVTTRYTLKAEEGVLPPGTSFAGPTFADQEDHIRLDYLWSVKRSIKPTRFPEEW